MAGYFARFFRRHMNALRLARWAEPDVPAGAGPFVIYVNHPSWWDAAVIILAAKALFPHHQTFAPFDAAMLQKYRIFGRIGAFAVDLESRRGAAEFLTASADVLLTAKKGARKLGTKGGLSLTAGSSRTVKLTLTSVGENVLEDLNSAKVKVTGTVPFGSPDSTKKKLK